MNDSSLSNSPQVFGFFELDANGTVLYSRPVSGDISAGNNFKIIGLDFFRDVFLGENAEHFRRKFLDFVNGGLMTERFVFNSLSPDAILKIMLVKVLENNGMRNKKIIYVDIRQG